jgi:hypothetical protein
MKLFILNILLIFIILACILRTYNFCHLTKIDKNKIKDGRKYSKQSNIIIASCIRDGEKYVKNNIIKIYKYFSKYFRKVKVVVLENDSKDKTREILLSLRDKIDIDVVGCGLNTSHCQMKLNNDRTSHDKKRVRRMAFIRNELLNHIKNIQKDYDYCLVFEADQEYNIIANGGLFESIYYLKNNKNIDGVACYGVKTVSFYGQIYDDFAHKSNCRAFLEMFGFGMKKVESSFNGLVIYKLPFGVDIKYNEKTNDCEHIDFHKQMNFYLNKNFRVEIDDHFFSTIL